MLVGLNDMLADMGLAGQYDHPRVREIYRTVIEACRRHGKHCGVGGLASRPDLMAEYVRMGARYVSAGTDLSFLLGASAARAKQIGNQVVGADAPTSRRYMMEMPPSTISVAPVTKDASSLASQMMGHAISCGVAQRASRDVVWRSVFSASTLFPAALAFEI